jgi:hypothetical protein
MFKAIYYALGVAFLLHEMGWIIDPVAKAKDSIAFRTLSAKYKGLKWEAYPQEYKDQLKSKIWSLLYIVFILGGLFTFQWWAFLVFLVLQFTIVAILSKILKPYLYPFATLHWINSLIGFAFTLFVIINSYHLKIELSQVQIWLNVNGWAI